MRVFNVGILGCGDISNTYASDIRALYPQLNITACADILPAAAQALAERHLIPKVMTPEEMLNDDETEIIINLTPPQVHTEINRKIIRAGKHLFSEKPFAQTLREAEETASLAREHGLMIGCAPDTFLSSGLQSVRYYLDSEPFYRKGNGPLYDMAPYYLSALVALFGGIDSVAAYSAAPCTERRIYTGPRAGEHICAEVPTHYSSILKMRCGVVANLNVSFDIYRSELPMFEICGDGGTLSYPDPNFGGGTPKVYRKEQYTDPILNHSPEAETRRKTFRELPEVFSRARDYSRGIGVLDMAAAIERGGVNRAGADMAVHITEAIEGLIRSSESGAFYHMRTACERPAPLKTGSACDEIS